MALLLEIESSIGYSVICHALLHFNLWNIHDLTHLLASIPVEFLQITPSNQVGVRAQVHPLLLNSRQLPEISSFKESKHHQEEPQVWMFFFIFIHLSKFKNFLHSWVRARFKVNIHSPNLMPLLAVPSSICSHLSLLFAALSSPFSLPTFALFLP